jgi:putative ABC transport system permease protein
MMSPVGGLSWDVADRLEALDEVAVASATTTTLFQQDEQVRWAMGIDPATVEQTISFGDVDGDIAAMQGGGLALRHDAAQRAGLAVGDEIEIALPRTGTVVVPIRAVYHGQIDVTWLLDRDTVIEGNRDARVQQVWVKLADGVTTDQARPILERALEGFPSATLLDQAEQREEISEQVNQLLALMSALLLLSVLIALFGIVNTLGLSVFERTAELGLLRAIGMTRKQVRAVVRWESVLIALLGTTLGVVLAVGGAWGIVQALASESLGAFEVPVVQLTVIAVMAALAGVLAAVGPARRASRLDVLDAISTG